MPIVTISRMYGSGGSAVAERVARALGWTLLDNAVVDAVAERLGVPAAEVRAHEERVPTLVERLARSLALATPELIPPATGGTLEPREEQVVEVTERIIREAVARGPAVVVGRGAQAILADREDALHVLCHAPRAALIARTMTRLDVAREEAERVVVETNRQREQYVKRHWQRAWRDAANYHLCLDTDWLGIDAAADLIARVARDRLG